MHRLRYDLAYGFDPGDTTGVCILETFVATPQYRLGAMEYGDFLEFLRSCDPRKALVVFEDFVSRPTEVSRVQKAPRVIGAVEFWAYRSTKILKIQPAQTHKIRREDVKAAGWTWKTEHEFDAIRILIYGLTMLRYR